MDKLEMYRHLYALVISAASEAIEHMDLLRYDMARDALTEALEIAEEFYMEECGE